MSRSIQNENEQFYEDVVQIIKRVSNRTLEMKTNNVKLLNKIGNEMNVLLDKAQEIVRMCLSDRSEFIKEVELIQLDFIELGKKIDEKFTNLPSSNPSSTKNVSNLQRVLSPFLSPSRDFMNEQINETSSSEEEITRQINVAIPDTCLNVDKFNSLRDKNKLENRNKEKFIIRDTIDCGDFLQDVRSDHLKEIAEATTEIDTTSEDLERTTLMSSDSNKPSEKIVENKKLKRLNTEQQSTPLSVKKKLQEHGLLDMTNSPETTKLRSKTPDKIDKTKVKNAQTPNKYIQKLFSPVAESPEKDKLIGTLTRADSKFGLFLKTPTKSPSLLGKNKNPISQINKEKTESTTINENSNNNPDDSLDYSFEFREKANSKKSSIEINRTNSSSSSSLMSKVKLSAKTLSTQSKPNNEKNLTSMEDEIPSPKKTQQELQQRNKAKRFKQLTMTQALNNTQSPNKSKQELVAQFSNAKQSQKSISSKSIFKMSSKEKLQDFEETCLPTEPPHEVTRLNIVKDEPMENEDDFNSNNENSCSNSKDGSKKSQLDDDFFSDFDKVPKKKNTSPSYKCVQVVRKHDERKKLPTSACRECETYWNSLPEHMRPKRMDEACRHRAKYQPPPTPEHYWSVSFPNTQECIERGYGGVIAQNDKEDQLAARRPRRKRPLKLITNNNNNDEDKNTDNQNMDDFDFLAND